MPTITRNTVSILMAIFVFSCPTLSEVFLNGPEYALQGGSANLECRVKNFSTKSAIDNAVIKRDTGTPGLPLLRTLATKNGRHPDAPPNVDVAVSTLSDGSLRILLTLNGVTRDDAAVYTCTAGRQLPTGYISLGVKTLHLAILYPPLPNFPTCSVGPPKPSGDLDRQVNDIVQLSCTSELANPHVNLIWGRTGEGTIPNAIEFMQSSTIRSEVTVTLTSQDNGAYFVCIGKSAAFPNYAENCVIGPFKLSSDQGLSPTTEVMNTSSFAEWEMEPTKCNSSFVGIMLDMKSPYVIGGIAGVGFILLLAFMLLCICCLIKCCRCCCKKKPKQQQQDDSVDSKDIHLVMTTSATNSKENLNETGSKDPQTPPPKYSTLAGCVTAETTLTVKAEEKLMKPSFTVKSEVKKTKSEVKSKEKKTKSAVKSEVKKTKSAVKSEEKKTKSAVKSEEKKTKPPTTVKSEEKKIQPFTAPIQRVKVTKRSKKEYPPPPNYPRPMKGRSLKISDRDAQMIHDAVVYGNVKNNGLANSEEPNPYSNIKRVKRNRPKSTPIHTRSTPSPTRHLQEPFKSELTNGSPLLGSNPDDSVPYSNWSVARRGTRPSPTPNRPNIAPPPPPQDTNDSSDELQIGENERKTEKNSETTDTKKSNGSIDKLTKS